MLDIAAPLLLAALLFLAGAAAFRRLRPWQSYLHRKPILTPNEREFFHRLTRALPTNPIFPQVAMSALMDVDGQLSERRRFAIRRRFAWKTADFIICAPYTLEPLLIIELDDRTHDARQDRQRDAMTAQTPRSCHRGQSGSSRLQPFNRQSFGQIQVEPSIRMDMPIDQRGQGAPVVGL